MGKKKQKKTRNYTIIIDHLEKVLAEDTKEIFDLCKSVEQNPLFLNSISVDSNLKQYVMAHCVAKFRMPYNDNWFKWKNNVLKNKDVEDALSYLTCGKSITTAGIFNVGYILSNLEGMFPDESKGSQNQTITSLAASAALSFIKAYADSIHDDLFICRFLDKLGYYEKQSYREVSCGAKVSLQHGICWHSFVNSVMEDEPQLFVSTFKEFIGEQSIEKLKKTYYIEIFALCKRLYVAFLQYDSHIHPGNALTYSAQGILHFIVLYTKYENTGKCARDLIGYISQIDAIHFTSETALGRYFLKIDDDITMHLFGANEVIDHGLNKSVDFNGCNIERFRNMILRLDRLTIEPTFWECPDFGSILRLEDGKTAECISGDKIYAWANQPDENNEVTLEYIKELIAENDPSKLLPIITDDLIFGDKIAERMWDDYLEIDNGDKNSDRKLKYLYLRLSIALLQLTMTLCANHTREICYLYHKNPLPDQAQEAEPKVVAVCSDQKSEAAEKRQEAMPIVLKQASIEEVNKLQKQLYNAEKENTNLKHRIADLENKLERDRMEMASMRELIYNRFSDEKTAEDDTADSNEQFPCHTPGKVLVLGGHDTWLNQITWRLPDVVFLGRNRNFARVAMIKSADVLFIQPNAISHAYFYNAIGVARSNKVPIRYMTYASAKRCAEQIVKTLKELGLM